mgnify:CR=1 FL=1
MPLIQMKPTSPGARHVVRVVTPGLHKGEPYAPLLAKKSNTGGRNNNGHITTRHKGGGHKQHYRLVDFKRDKDGGPGKVERLECDPKRSGRGNAECRRYVQLVDRWCGADDYVDQCRHWAGWILGSTPIPRRRLGARQQHNQRCQHDWCHGCRR